MLGSRCLYLMALMFVMSVCACARLSLSRGSTIHVVVGSLVTSDSPATNGMYSSATYRIEEKLAGTIHSTNIVVLFYAASVPQGGLPKRAFLAVERLHDAAAPVPASNAFVLTLFVALGMDAQRGILPDTPENRQQFKEVDLQALASNPRRLRLAESEAVIRAEAALQQRGIRGLQKVSVTRDHYGYAWRAQFVSLAGPMGEVNVIVGDDGRVKAVYWGM